MNTLFIDTHYLDIHIILFKNGLIKKRKDIINIKNNSEYIMPAIKFVCNPEEIDNLIVINGPGSFTGVRLGVTIAKTLAYTLNKPIKVLSYFDVLYASNNKLKGYYSINDNNGFYITKYEDIEHNDYKYLSNSEYSLFINDNDIYSNIEVNYEKVYEYSKVFNNVNPHLVNPLYIKTIEAQK